MKTSFQKIQKKYKNEFEVARVYYALLSALNDLRITAKELDLIAFCAINGTISTPPVREEFIKSFNVPRGSVYNMVSKLQKMKIFIKDKEHKVRVNPSIQPDFSKSELLLAIKLFKDGN